MFSALMKWMQANKILPQISDTERQALEAGSVWIDGQFFAGQADFAKILAEPYGQLTAEEQAFIDGPCEELLAMFNRYDIQRTKRIPDEVFEFVKKNGFMSFLIPKQYGGLQFSTLAISTIMAKLSAYNGAVGTFVVIPNSLGAAELIKHYGTQQQKDDYLPKLATGEYVPCFGLTEPTAGSDAASIKAEGLVFRDSDGELKLKLNFRKRYITLAPLANLATIACRVHDPDNLLGKGEDVGITCVLLHKGTPGFSNGDHHDPIGDPFYNGPLIGKDVVVPVGNIIGGADYAGQGWRMLMEQLAGGRMVSLPAGAIGNARVAAAMTGAYSTVRQQFGISIGQMEGIEDKVGKMAALSYMLEGARIFGCTAVDNGIQPPVVSSVMKAYTTEIGRQLVTDGMDVFSGAGVMQGPNNILGAMYKSAPVSITVEGANIMTRTLMIFGQGATRCHPYALNVVHAVENSDVPKFRKNLLGWIGHFIGGLFRAEWHFLTRGAFVKVPDVAPETRKYYKRLGWTAARYGVLTDLAMFAIGGKLKARGKLTGRYADALAWQILALGALRRYEAEGRKTEDLPLVQYACEYALAQVQDAYVGIYQNFDGPMGAWMKTVGVFEARLNPVGAMPKDDLSVRAARTIQHYTPQYERLAANVFMPKNEEFGMARLFKAFKLVSATQTAYDTVAKAQRARKLPRGYTPADIADEAVKAGVISAEQAQALKDAQAARLAAIEVDAFKPEQYFAEVTPADGIEYKMAVNS
ncbi:acyl-CoA dehydrogenase [Solimonas marina]|uniref:Acyl-coenzyme A dehydrogenase n=1 Tax=Solimonas marina TaxID=2714601 RepID=A0A969WFL1_9GAMM|nr:acyl-CoA dehydrogenase [Solimonas marina]NKF23835.1 acyl-CoA dehydrogenase [Solimonas marina]